MIRVRFTARHRAPCTPFIVPEKKTTLNCRGARRAPRTSGIRDIAIRYNALGARRAPLQIPIPYLQGSRRIVTETLKSRLLRKAKNPVKGLCLEILVILIIWPLGTPFLVPESAGQVV